MHSRRTVVLFDPGMREGGHHDRYRRLLFQLLAAPGDSGRVMGSAAVWARQPILAPTIENAFLAYAAVSLFRALWGRRTTGLLFRPGPALIGDSFRLRVKRLLLKTLRRSPYVRTLTITSFAVEPRFAEIADGWIHDLQLWDLDAEERETAHTFVGALQADIKAAAAGRRVCCAIGGQDKNKGFDWFVETYTQNDALRGAMLFAFGGEVAANAAAHLPAFQQAGGFACNRHVSDAELLDIYAAADLVWCAYDPGYDQASGILGRAAQLGVPVVVRRGSLIHRMCEIEKITHIAIDRPTDWRLIAAPPPRESRTVAEARAARMAAESLRRLREALEEAE